jgi:hypothetical protein
VLVVGEAKLKVPVVPTTPVSGLELVRTDTTVVSEEQLEPDPL